MFHARLRLFIIAVTIFGISCESFGGDWQSQFHSPPASARPQTWWHWMHGNVTRDGITKDLEAMKSVGLGGFQAFHVSTRIPPGPVKYLSPEWRSLMAHAVREADRLGLDFGLHNCAGWSSSGGPWITPDNSMLQVVWTERRVHGGADDAISVEPPQARIDFYRDICVLAFPTPLAEQNGAPPFQLDQWRGKAGFDRVDAPQPDERKPATDAVIPFDSIVDLTTKLRGDVVQWRPPVGEWTIMRFGYTTTLRTNSPAPDEGRGLECDKLSKKGADQHWQGIVQHVLDDAGPRAGRVLNNLLIDSYETGQQNWTHAFAREFRDRRGYDPTPYLPSVTGRVIADVSTTERFLWDFRRTIADLFCENYYGRFAELCHERGLKLAIEPYGGWTGNFHDLDLASQADIPMGEFWANRSADWCDWSVKLAASAAHAAGQPIVGAESYTSAPDEANWSNHPGALKAQGDLAFSQGLTRIIFHTYAHQPWSEAIQPGMTMGEYGMQLNRNNTWFGDARAWMDYLARCQYVLQQGEFVADFCYVASENAPNRMRRREELSPPPPSGYDYDMIATPAMMTMRVEDGRVVLPSGMGYRFLVLPDESAMRPEVIAKVAELADAGAFVIGPLPKASPSLEGYPDCDEQVRRTSERLTRDGRIRSGLHEIEGVLRDTELLPDFQAINANGPQPLVTLHRRIGGDDAYFVSNQSKQTVRCDCVLRVAGKSPEIWDPMTGEQSPATLWRSTSDGRTAVNVTLPPHGSLLIVLLAGRPATPHATMVRGPRGQFDAAPLQKAVVIQRAVYGAPGGRADQHVDVTARVSELVAQGQLEIMAGNQLGGDPAFNVVKVLTVDYLVQGDLCSQTVKEGEQLSLRDEEASPSSPPLAQLAASDGTLVLQAFEPGDYAVELGEGPSLSRTVGPLPTPLEISGPWDVTLVTPLASPGAKPDSVQFETLRSLSEHADDRVRHFSGTASYQTTFHVDPSALEKHRLHRLQLGRVAVLAKVEINGVPLGTLWKSPYEVDVSGKLVPGKNELIVHVTTLWINRLIGDQRAEAPDETQRYLRDAVIPPSVWEGKPPRPGGTYSTWRHWLASDPLVPTGLIGPVRISWGDSIPIVGTDPQPSL
ncbi:MAG: hypothetical protein KF847_10105 [Pirellulales bacterium]|nr:hypothetical protein [Pirellulales bacterium]